MKIASCLIVSFILFGLFSCDNNSGMDKPISSTIIFDDTLNISLLFLETELQIQMPMRFYVQNKQQDLSCELNSKEWRNLLSFIQNYTKENSDIWLIIIYIDKYLNKNDSVNYKDIIGFQVYTIKPNKKLYHSIFIAEDGNFLEIKQYNCETVGIHYNARDYFMNYEMNYHNASAKKNSVISFFSENMYSYKPDKYSHDFLMRRIEKFGKKY